MIELNFSRDTIDWYIASTANYTKRSDTIAGIVRGVLTDSMGEAVTPKFSPRFDLINNLVDESSIIENIFELYNTARKVSLEDLATSKDAFEITFYGDKVSPHKIFYSFSYMEGKKSHRTQSHDNYDLFIWHFLADLRNRNFDITKGAPVVPSFEGNFTPNQKYLIEGVLKLFNRVRKVSLSLQHQLTTEVPVLQRT